MSSDISISDNSMQPTVGESPFIGDVIYIQLRGFPYNRFNTGLSGGSLDNQTWQKE